MDGAEGVFKAVDRRHDCADPPEQERIPCATLEMPPRVRFSTKPFGGSR